MKLIVTGGAGFVGSNLCSFLAPTHELLVLDDLSIGDESNLPAEAELIQLNLAAVDEPYLADVLQGFEPDAVVHLAALCFIPDCLADPERALATNVRGTDVLCRVLPPSCRRFVFASTADVYPVNDKIHRESDEPAPRNPYGLSKVLGEEIVEYTSWVRDDLSAVSLRFANVYGPGETHRYVIPEVLRRLELKDEPELSMGFLGGERDFVHVGDVTSAVSTLLSAETGRYRVYNIGTGTSTPVRRVVEILQEMVGDERQLQEDAARFRKFDRHTLSVDVARIQDETVWRPKIALIDGLAALVEERFGVRVTRD